MRWLLIIVAVFGLACVGLFTGASVKEKARKQLEETIASSTSIPAFTPASKPTTMNQAKVPTPIERGKDELEVNKNKNQTKLTEKNPTPPTPPPTQPVPPTKPGDGGGDGAKNIPTKTTTKAPTKENPCGDDPTCRVPDCSKPTKEQESVEKVYCEQQHIIATKDTEIATQKEALAAKEKTIGKQNSEISKLTKEKKDLDGKIIILGNEVSKLQTGITDLAEENAELKNKLNEKKCYKVERVIGFKTFYNPITKKNEKTPPVIIDKPTNIEIPCPPPQ